MIHDTPIAVFRDSWDFDSPERAVTARRRTLLEALTVVSPGLALEISRLSLEDLRRAAELLSQYTASTMVRHAPQRLREVA